MKDLASLADASGADSAGQAGRWQNTAQLRLNLAWYPFGSMKAALGSRHLMVLQSNIGEASDYAGPVASVGGYYFDLDGERATRNSTLTTAVDRLYLDWTYRSLEVTAGRQRIAWGTCLVWNPLDLFNPYSVLDFDYEEKPGSDALRVQVYTGPVSTMEAAGGPGRDRRHVTYGIRYLRSLGGYDLAVVGGWERQFWRLGTGWAGQIAGGGFRGEILYSSPDGTVVAGSDTGIASVDGVSTGGKLGDFWTAAVSYDYTFRNSLYIHGELLYNGLGTTGEAGLRWAATPVAGELGPARYSIFQEVAYDLTPLLRGDVFVVFNPNDRSWISIASAAYAFATDWELDMLAIPAGGKVGSEFGGTPGRVALRLRYDF